jgi:hypothetical protein
VFINPTTITTATLLRDLADAEGTTVTKSALRQQWALQSLPLTKLHHSPTPQTPRPPDKSKKHSTH